MADVHTRLLRLSDDDFRASLVLLNEAMARDQVALVWTDKNAVHDLVVFDEGDLDDETYERLRDLADGLDQLMVFAFESAPGRVVTDWGDEHGDGLGAVAARRVDLLEELAPAIAEEWRTRFDGVGRVLGEVKTRLIYSFESSDARMILRADSFDTSGPRRTPIASSRSRFEVALTRRDLKWLIALLESASEVMPTPDDLPGEEVDESE